MGYIIAAFAIGIVAYVVIRHRRNRDSDDTEQGVGGSRGGPRNRSDAK